jgi:hypothetical protein
MKNVTELTEENRKEQILKIANYISESEVNGQDKGQELALWFDQNNLVHHTLIKI